MSRLLLSLEFSGMAKVVMPATLGVIVLVIFATSNSFAQVVTDDFSDLNDTANPAWTRLDGLVMSTGQTWDASTGVYRMAAPSNGATINNVTYGFVGSHVGPEYSDVRVSMDVVEFYTIFAPPNGPEFVNIMARSNGNNEFAGLTGYAYGYDPFSNAGAGEVVLYRNDAGDPFNDIGSQRVTLDETKDYRFVLEVIANSIHGQVFEIGTETLVAESFKNIAINPGDSVYSSGTSGAFALTGSPFSTQWAIDNFRTEPALAGDYNRDGSVDAADYVVWRKTVGQTSPELDPNTFQVISFGNMSANGAVSGNCGFNTPNCEVIDEADYEVWRTNFGRKVSTSGTGSGSGGGAGSGAAAPEPTSAALALLAFAASACLRRRAK